MVIQSEKPRVVDRFKDRLEMQGEVNVFGHYIFSRNAIAPFGSANYTAPTEDLIQIFKSDIESAKIKGTRHSIVISDQRNPDAISNLFKIGLCTSKELFILDGGTYHIDDISMDDYVAVILDAQRECPSFQLSISGDGEIGTIAFESVFPVADNPPVFSAYRVAQIILSNVNDNPLHIAIEVLNYEQ